MNPYKHWLQAKVQRAVAKKKHAALPKRHHKLARRLVKGDDIFEYHSEGYVITDIAKFMGVTRRYVKAEIAKRA